MTSHISPPPETPPFLEISATDDPVVKRAQEIAANDEVSPDQTGFKNAMKQLRQSLESEVEHFQHNVSARASDAKTQSAMAYTTLTEHSQQIDEDPRGNTFAKIRATVREEIEALIVDTKFRGEDLMRHLIDVEGQFRRFQNDHKRKLPPRPPQNLIITLALLVALVIVEIVVNGFFFMDLTEHGLFGGVFEAFLFAPFNVFGALILGYYSLRYVQYKTTWMAVTAFIIGIVLLTFIIGLNVYLAALRLSLRPDVIYDIPQLLPLIVSPRILEIMDYKSLGILILGLTLAGIACWKAYRLKDPYPGYDEIGRSLNDARNAVKDFRDDYLDSLDELRDQAIEDFHKELKDFTSEAAHFQYLANALMQERKRYDTVCARITELYSARQALFHHLYTMNERLDTPVLIEVINENALSPQDDETEVLLTPIKEETLQEVLDIEKKVERYVREQEQAVTEEILSVRKNATDLFAQIRLAALKL